MSDLTGDAVAQAPLAECPFGLVFASYSSDVHEILGGHRHLSSMSPAEQSNFFAATWFLLGLHNDGEALSLPLQNHRCGCVNNITQSAVASAALAANLPGSLDVRSFPYYAYGPGYVGDCLIAELASDVLAERRFERSAISRLVNRQGLTQAFSAQTALA